MQEQDSIIDRISDEIISKINPKWSKIQKIRFVYLELGKYLEKNTDFFLNDKLGDLKESKDSILRFYQEDIIPVREIDQDLAQYQVICKSAALFLEVTLKKLNIEVLNIRTMKEEDGIRHWFLAAKEDNNDYLFLTLAADLPFIKNNMPTEHFGTHISYILNGEQYYDTPEEIPHRVLTKEELIEIDNSIGYSKLYPVVEKKQVNVDFDPKAYQQLFTISLAENSPFYDIFKQCLKINETEFKRVEDIPDTDFLNFLTKLNKYVFKEIYNRLNIEKQDTNNDINYDIQTVLKIIAKDNSISLNTNNPIKKQLKEIKKNLSKDATEIEVLNILNYLLVLNNNIKNYVYLKDGYKEEYEMAKNKVLELENQDITRENAHLFQQIINDERTAKKKLENLKRNVGMIELNEMLSRIALEFIKDQHSVKEMDFVPPEYIANKLSVMFPIVFETGSNEEHEATSFSIQGYSEQIVTIKRLLKYIFNELTYDNCHESYEYQDDYSPVENRIQTFPLKDRKTGEYCVGFNVTGCKEIEEEYYIYIPSINIFRKFNVLEEDPKYQVISNRFIRKINNLERSKAK